jgi:hypothetical protein
MIACTAVITSVTVVSRRPLARQISSIEFLDGDVDIVGVEIQHTVMVG